jgi:cell division protease FtsH
MGTAGVGRSPEGGVRLSETTLRIRDEERQDLIDEARRAAQKMIVAHRDQLDALAHELLEREVLDRDAIERIMSGVPRLERAPGVGLRVVAAAEPHDPPASPAAIDAPPGAGASPGQTLGSTLPAPGESEGTEAGRR